MIDLHVHTTNSDGRLKVKEILERAKKQGITTISFCDHNVVRSIWRNWKQENKYLWNKNRWKFRHKNTKW